MLHLSDFVPFFLGDSIFRTSLFSSFFSIFFDDYATKATAAESSSSIDRSLAQKKKTQKTKQKKNDRQGRTIKDVAFADSSRVFSLIFFFFFSRIFFWSIPFFSSNPVR